MNTITNSASLVAKKINHKKIILGLFLIFVSANVHAQLFYWDTSGLNGSEATHQSDYNDPNLAPGILTKGSGVTTAFNTNRFGGKGWPSTLSQAVAGNNYIEFIVTPVAGYVFTANSFFFIWEYEAGGPNTVTLRSSKDGFVSNLGTSFISSGGTGTIVIHGHDTVPVATKYRLYGYGATSTTAGGGFDCVASSANVSFEGSTQATPLPACLNPIAFPPGFDAPIDNKTDTLTQGGFTGFYYKINTYGETYQITSTGGADNYLTLRSGTSDGPVFARGPSTLTTSVSGAIFLHLNKDPYCTGDMDFRTITVQCLTCPPNPCDNITPIGCDVEETVSYQGSGLWDLSHCPGGTSAGQEKIFSFTPAITGNFSLIWTITQQIPHVQYFIRPQASGCGPGGWTCLGNFLSGPVIPIGTLIAGTPYYLLCDAGPTFQFNEAFKLHCPLDCEVNCSSNITVTTETDQCGTHVNYPPPVVTGGSCHVTGSTPPPGSFFPIGTTTVTATFDAAVICLFDITVVDVQLPIIQCPATISVIYNSPGTCTGTYTIIDPMSDNCSGGKWNATFSGNPNGNPPNTGDIADGFNSANITFQNGSTTVTLNVTDSSGNQATPCSFTIYVSDIEPPTLTASVSLVNLNTEPGGCTAKFTISDPLNDDNCPGSGTWSATFSGNANGNPPSTGIIADGINSDPVNFQIGTTAVTLHGTDASGNIASTINMFVEVRDNQLPTLACPVDQVINTSGLCSQTFTITDPVTDCSGATWNATFSGNANGNPPPTGNISDGTNSSAITFQKGTTTVTLNAKDIGGNNAAPCSFNVIVNDANAPIINCPGNIVTSNEPNQCGAMVGFTILAFDNCSGINLVSDPPSESFFPVGTTTVTTTATDASNNSANCTFTVKVNDTQPPVITCPANIVKCGSQVINYSLPSVTDNCPGVTVTPASGNISSGSVFPIGTTTLSFTATDASDNTATCSFTVTVNPSVTTSIQSNTGSFKFCKGSSIVLDGGNYISHQWSMGATSRMIATNSSATYTVIVTDANGCTGSATITTVRVNSSPSQPNVITGPVNGLCNSIGNVFSVAPVPNTDSYVWNVTNGIITSGQGSNLITVNFFGFSSSTVSVKAKNSCGFSGARSLNVSAKPLSPVVINGNKNGLCNAQGITYSVSPVAGATYYRWSVPSHVSIVLGQGTKDLVVNFNNSFSSGNIMCRAENPCGSSSSTSLSVSSKPQKPAIISGPIGVCRNQPGVLYFTPSVYGATDYIWKVPSGATIQSGQGTTNITIRFGNSSGKIEVYAKNSCGKTETRELRVSFVCREDGTDLIADEITDEINIYPNPAHDKLTVSLEFIEDKNCLLRLMDLSGRIVISEEHAAVAGLNSYELDLSILSKGVYFLVVESENDSFNKRIIVE